MSEKSDNRLDRSLSATEASRSFSKLLDEVEAGRRFHIHRRGAEDTLENTVAVCPNCHRKVHIRDDKEDREKLIRVAAQWERPR
jgi:5-methylcytosine-specific restriction endonuclease McrA